MAEKNANAWNRKAEQESAKKLKGLPKVPNLKGKGTVTGASNAQRRKAKDS